MDALGRSAAGTGSEEGLTGTGRARGFASGGTRPVGGAVLRSGYALALERLLAGEALEIPREVLDAWLAAHPGPEALLTARSVGGVEYLKRALELYPDNPQVLLASVELKEEPAVQRARLDRLKQLDPDNALGFYLSAADHQAAGRTEEALADLLAASGKSHFEDYVGEAMDRGRALLASLGRSDGEAALLGSSTVLLPHLARLKKLAQGLQEVQRQYLASGNTAGAETLAAMGVQLGRQLESGQGSGLLINQLVGLAVERLSLSELPASSTPGFLEGTVEEHLNARKARREELKEVHLGFEDWLRAASEEQVVQHYDRLRAHGEEAALGWVKTGAPAPALP